MKRWMRALFLAALAAFFLALLWVVCFPPPPWNAL